MDVRKLSAFLGRLENQACTRGRAVAGCSLAGTTASTTPQVWSGYDSIIVASLLLLALDQ